MTACYYEQRLFPANLVAVCLFSDLFGRFGWRAREELRLESFFGVCLVLCPQACELAIPGDTEVVRLWWQIQARVELIVHCRSVLNQDFQKISSSSDLSVDSSLPRDRHHTLGTEIDGTAPD
jgi:hypothetical protein